MDKINRIKKCLPIMLLGIFSLFSFTSGAQIQTPQQHQITKKKPGKKSHFLYGTASYYAKKFTGRRMANGEIYQPEKFTAACNVLPLDTWIKVTNLRNKRSVIVKIKDRMNRRNKRLVDLSEAAAKKLGYFSSGLTKVKVEVLQHYSP